MRKVPSPPDASGSAGQPPHSRTAPDFASLLLARLAGLGVASYACVASMSAPSSIIYSGCMIGRDEPFHDLYYRVPCALVALSAMAWAADRYLPEVAKFARCTALVSVVMWGLSVGLARGWW